MLYLVSASFQTSRNLGGSEHPQTVCNRLTLLPHHEPGHEVTSPLYNPLRPSLASTLGSKVFNILVPVHLSNRRSLTVSRQEEWSGEQPISDSSRVHKCMGNWKLVHYL